MNQLILSLLVSVLLLHSQTAFSEDRLTELTNQIVSYDRTQRKLINNGGSLADVTALADAALIAASGIQTECDSTSEKYPELHRKCSKILQIFSEGVAELKMNAAKYAVKLGEKAVAKQQYRDIIVTFTGKAYTSFIKQAEFGLEDLK